MNRLKINLIVFVLSVFLFSCKNNSDKLKILEFQESNINQEEMNISKFYESNSLSMMFGHHNSRYIDNRVYRISLSAKNDKLFIYNATDDDLNTIVLDSTFPKFNIDQIYYHNKDSIFIFYVREHLMRIEFYDSIDIDFDFVLIDSKGKIKNKYSLDKVPYIHKVSINKMGFLKKNFITENQIVNNSILLPFTFYKPRCFDEGFEDFWPEMLCKYNLKTKELEMLNIRFPEEDIGKYVAQKVVEPTIDFNLINNGNILYVHQYSPSIYEFNIEENKLMRKIDFNKFQFNNRLFEDSSAIDQSSTQVRFYAPKYLSGDEMYIRDIEVLVYKDYQRFRVVQFFDREMKLLGYSFADSVYSFIYKSGNKLCGKKVESGEAKNISICGSHFLSLSEIEEKILKQKKEAKSGDKQKYILDINSRLLVYSNKLKIKPGSKVVLINSDFICSSCIKELFQTLSENEERFVEKNVFYVFYGDDSKLADDIVNNYKLNDSKSIIKEFSGLYQELIEKKERNKYYFIDYKINGDVEVVPSDYKDVPKNLYEFLK
jgi:hypothetical protein